jgi:hypothetical protein
MGWFSVKFFTAQNCETSSFYANQEKQEMFCGSADVVKFPLRAQKMKIHQPL